MRRLVLLGLVAVAACEREGGDDPDDPKPLLDRWAAALGGREHLAKAWHAHSRWRVDQGLAHHTGDEYDARDGKHLTINDDGVSKTRVVFDGTRDWLIDANGFRTEVGGRQRASIVSTVYYRNFGWALAPQQAKITRSGETLTIEPAGGVATTIAFDPKTHLPVSFTRHDGDALADDVVTEPVFTKVDGYLKETGDSWHDGLGAHGTAERLAYDDDVPAHAFDEPADRPAPHLDAPIVLPMRLVDHYWHVTLQVAGAPTDMQLSAIDASFRLGADTIAARNLATKGDFNFSDAGGKPSGRYVTDVTIEAGAAKLEHLTGLAPVRVQPNSVGAVLYHAFVIELDPTNQELRLHDRDTFRPPAAPQLPLSYDRGLLEVPLTITLDDDTAVTGAFALSFSDGAPLVLGGPFAKANQLETHSTPVAGDAQDGKPAPRYVHVKRITAGGAAIAADVYAGLGTNENGSRASLAGSVSTHAYRGRTLVLDLAHNRAWIVPQERH